LAINICWVEIDLPDVQIRNILETPGLLSITINRQGLLP
jgi:hypothetical protein